MGNASAEAAISVADGAAEDGPGVLAAAGVRPPRPRNWGSMTKTQKRHWFHRHGKWKWKWKTDWALE